jgi:DNA-directed RNA polymerase subunit beta
MKELQSLGLDVNILDDQDEEVEMRDTEEDDASNQMNLSEKTSAATEDVTE